MKTESTNELFITRIFDAPRALVWQAWTDPVHVMKWQGPAGFNNESCTCDLRVGGRFRLDMRAPDGNVYPCIGTYSEIIEPERIVYEGEAIDGHPCGAGIPPRAEVKVLFAEQNGKTHLTLHTIFASAERKQAAAAARYVVSWEETLERLAENIGGQGWLWTLPTKTDIPVDTIRRIRAPALVVVGDADVIRPEHAIEMFRALPRAQLAVFPGTDHMQVTARTEWLVTMINVFLDAPAAKYPQVFLLIHFDDLRKDNK